MRRTLTLLTAMLLALGLFAGPAIARHGGIGEIVTAVNNPGPDPDPEAVPFLFDPDNPTITAGTNVEFRNDSADVHTLSGTQGGFDSGAVFPDGDRIVSTEHLRPDDYEFFCRVHPYMRGTLTVTAE